MGREGEKEMKKVIGGQVGVACVCGPNPPPCFQAVGWRCDRADLNPCGLPADAALLHPPVCPWNLVTKTLFLLLCSCFTNSPPLPTVVLQGFWQLFLRTLSLCVSHLIRSCNGWLSLCIAKYANDPAMFFCTQDFVWCSRCQGTSCHHVNGWCSSLGTAVPHCPLCLTLLLSLLQAGSSLQPTALIFALDFWVWLQPKSLWDYDWCWTVIKDISVSLDQREDEESGSGRSSYQPNVLVLDWGREISQIKEGQHPNTTWKKALKPVVKSRILFVTMNWSYSGCRRRISFSVDVFFFDTLSPLCLTDKNKCPQGRLSFRRNGSH